MFNLFGGKKSEAKNNGYFLELDESQPVTEAPAAVESAPAETAEPTPKTNKTSAEKVKASEPAPAPQPVSAPIYDTEAIIIAAIEAGSKKAQEQEAMEFKSAYSITPTLSRRRPGPSLKMFQNMASQMKVPTPRV